MHEKIKTKLLSQSPLYIIHAEKKLTLAGSGGSIIIDDIGITIKAKQLKINASSVNIDGGGVDQINALTAATEEGVPFCEVCAKIKRKQKIMSKVSRLASIFYELNIDKENKLKK